jgi:hypothetical protein
MSSLRSFNQWVENRIVQRIKKVPVVGDIIDGVEKRGGGPGLDAEEQKQVFDHFAPANNNGKQPNVDDLDATIRKVREAKAKKGDYLTEDEVTCPFLEC